MFESSREPRSILVVAAHPDDEAIGMGGTIARHTAAGDTVHVLFLNNGVGARGAVDPAEVSRRRDAAERACALLGARISGFGSFPDNAFDTVPLLEVARWIEQAKRTVKPDVVYTHHGGDLNVDHRIACQAVLTAFRPQPHEHYTELLSFEVSSSTEWAVPSVTAAFLPDTFVDTSRHLQTALAAYACYESEVRPEPHARSVEAVRLRALHRGRQVGLEAAEAFMTLRRIVR